MANNPIIIGSKECPIIKVVSLLKSCESFPEFHNNWSSVARDLGSNGLDVRKLHDDYICDLTTLEDIVLILLEKWVGLEGENATIHELCHVLRKNELNNCAEYILQILNEEDEEATGFENWNKGEVAELETFQQNNNTTNHIIVGSDECPITKVVKLLKSSPAFPQLNEVWPIIVMDLNIGRDVVRRLKNGYAINRINLEDIVYEILEEWVKRKGVNATLQELCHVLSQNELKGCADLIIKGIQSLNAMSNGENGAEEFPNAVPNTMATELLNIGIGCEVSDSESCITFEVNSSIRQFEEKWRDVAVAMGTSNSAILMLQKRLHLDTLDMVEVMHELLEKWIGREGENVTLQQLSLVLNNNGLQDCAGFLVNQSIATLNQSKLQMADIDKTSDEIDSAFNTKHIMVGSKECPITTAVSLVKSAGGLTILHERWRHIAIDLGTERDIVNRLRRDYLLGTQTIFDIFHELFEEWVARSYPQVSLQELCSVLKDNGLVDCSETLLREIIKLNEPNNLNTGEIKQFKKYCQLPTGLQGFLESLCNFQYCVIQTLDAEITCDKIRENFENCSFWDWEEFWKSVSTSKLCDENMIVSGFRADGLDELNTLLENVKGNGKAVFVIQVEQNMTCPPALQNVSSSRQKSVTSKKSFLTTILEYWNIYNLFNTTSKVDIHPDVICYVDTILWDNLTRQHQLEITKMVENTYNLKVKTEQISGQALINLINQKEIKPFNETLPKELTISYYVDRTITTRNIISSEIFEQTSKDIFVFTGIDRYELSNLAKSKLTDTCSNQLRQKNVTTNFLVLEDRNDFDKICGMCPISSSVHFLRCNKTKLEWIQSAGNLKAIQKYVEKEESKDELSEQLFISKFRSESNQPVIISDSPGMGKSILLGKFGVELKKIHPGRLVLFVVFSEFMKVVESGQGTRLPAIIASLVKVICENIVQETIFKILLDSEETTIELMLDGFDELKPVKLKLAYKVLQVLTSLKSIRVWITSRPHLLEELENNLQVLGYNIKPFEKPDQIKFLSLYWSRQGQPNKTKLEEFAVLSILLICEEFMTSVVVVATKSVLWERSDLAPEWVPYA